MDRVITRFLFKMDTLNQVDFPKQMQKLLLKKEQEYGQLKFISSRATEETSCFIDELLETVTNITKTVNLYHIELFCDEDSSKLWDIPGYIITNYNHILLNTNFSSQYLLAEDMLCGHIVNLWPTLSPYLFIQIIWHIKCEDLLIESLMHLPLDLCMEILEITVRCINELEMSRAKRLVILLISKLYYKCQWLHLGTLSNHDIAELSQQLVAHFQTLLNTVKSTFIPLKLSVQEKYVQHGIFLKRMLCCIKTCMHYKTKNLPYDNPWIKYFKITYGNPHGVNYFYKLPIDEVKSIMAILDQELIALLLNEIKEVDCFEFMAWMEVDDEENIMISLQRAFIIECHYFMEFMKQDEFLFMNEHLLHCLQQLVGPHSEKSILSLQELCDSIEKDNLDGMKELMRRYKTWDLSILKFVCGKIKLLHRDDIGILLEYLQFKFATNDYIDQHEAYMLMLEVLMRQQLLDMYYIVLQYTLRHFDDNYLICMFNNEHFKSFIESNVNMHDHVILRTILIFVLLHPKKVLRTLVRVAIGSTEIEYQNVVFKRPQIYFLYAFFMSQLNNQNNLLTYFLNDAWNCDRSTWSYKQFETFMNDMLQEEEINSDDLLNNFYIPCLTNDLFNCSNLLSVLIHMYFVLKEKIKDYLARTNYVEFGKKLTCNSDKTNYVLLIKQLTKRMSMLRKCNSMYSKSTVNNLLNRGTMILHLLFTTPNLLTMSNRNEIIKINNIIEPIDQILLKHTSQLQTVNRGTVCDVIQNYEKRCLITYQLLRDNNSIENQKSKSNLLDQFDVYSFELDQKALIRHMMLHSSEKEYELFANEMTVMSSSYFGWANELMAYANVLHITAEAMQLALMFTHIFPKDTFVSLLRALVRYCNVFARLKHHLSNSRKEIYNSLSTVLLSLKNTVNETAYGEMYDDLLKHVNDMGVNSNTEITHYFHIMIELLETYNVQFEKIESASTTSVAVDMLEAYKFVCSCINDTSRDT
ncbi:uncharacterized protein LOC105195480 isoform X2 [Solenopsis invicta]|uniref:uncharacterized protein LOC105195480 isoform X2 n=1 Tax=Solenopsis invicta TaxID=13686 RepID=UPI00193E40D8|nr:uncharacterized protein LOC105195480 isoform X2 [Solenopsis invicta]